MPYTCGWKVPFYSSLIHPINKEYICYVPGPMISSKVTEVGDTVFGLLLRKPTGGAWVA